MSQNTSIQSAIVWPIDFQPGTTDNFVSNESIAADLTASQVWAQLADISKWSTYYHNVSDITPPTSGPKLQEGATFHFSTFGFPVLECTVRESVDPIPPGNLSSGQSSDGGQAGRIAWSAALDGNEDEKVRVYHAWLVEDLPGGRVRILTQESQIGKPAAELAGKRPNVMLLGHQDWIDGLVAKAKGKELAKEDTNLAKAGLLAY